MIGAGEATALRWIKRGASRHGRLDAQHCASPGLIKRKAAPRWPATVSAIPDRSRSTAMKLIPLLAASLCVVQPVAGALVRQRFVPAA